MNLGGSEASVAEEYQFYLQAALICAHATGKNHRGAGN